MNHINLIKCCRHFFYPFLQILMLMVWCKRKVHCYFFSIIMESLQWPNNYPDSKVHGAHLGPTGPRWAPCWPHELCYLGMLLNYGVFTMAVTWTLWCLKSLASQWTICSGWPQRNYQSSTSLALCEGNPLVTSGFPSQRASNAERISVPWSYHVISLLHQTFDIYSYVHLTCFPLGKHTRNIIDNPLELRIVAVTITSHINGLVIDLWYWTILNESMDK